MSIKEKEKKEFTLGVIVGQTLCEKELDKDWDLREKVREITKSVGYSDDEIKKFTSDSGLKLIKLCADWVSDTPEGFAEQLFIRENPIALIVLKGVSTGEFDLLASVLER